jgi:hypothetical protein
LTSTPGNHAARPLAAITGASSGIGETFARKLAARGYDLLLIARRRDRLVELAAELARQHNTQAEPLPADLIAESDLARVEQRLRDEPRLAFLINNAGFGARSLFHEADLATQDAMHRLHVIATMRLTRAALPGMVARDRGGIVNVSSVAAFMQGPHNVSYCSTKAWMNSFTEGLTLELRSIRSRVRVQALCPGFTKTEFHQTMGIGREFVAASWWMTADDVVDDSLRGLDRGRWLVIPGWRYKLIVTVFRHAPRSLVHMLAGRAPNVRRGSSPSQ